MISLVPAFIALAGLASTASAHIAFWHKSMYGFNVTDNTYSYDNRPQVPLYDMTFDQWWMHGHIDHPPNSGDFFELPAGGKVNTELSCDKGATSWYESSQGGDVGYGSNSPCPGAPTSAFHTTGLDDVKGCALAIAYQSDVHALKPDDFTIFSVNHTCVWDLNTEFEVPNLPACPEDGCHCAWFWIHSIESGAEQIYMNGFKCKVTGDVGTQALGKPALPRRCGLDANEQDAKVAVPGNCTVGAKLPMYWYQKEGNNMFEDTYHAPYYNDLYGFHDGAQNDIFNSGVIADKADFAVSSTAPVSTHAAVAPSPTSQVTTSPAPTADAPKPTTDVTNPPSETPKPTTDVPKPPSEGAEPTSEGTKPTSTSTSSANSPSSTKQCKRSKKAKKRSHARHLSGSRH
ncbi:hypothetical protein C8Q80DRAFT_1161505 [Daedaleopsis nitida]|nr:hypothetical protein C8Q80DRAFT_1161505 [Daedaleopsis nitida]